MSGIRLALGVLLWGCVMAALLAAWTPTESALAQQPPVPGNDHPLIQPPPPPIDPNAGNAELAWRVSDMAQNIIRVNRQMIPAHWELAGNLLDAAARLDPKEERYPRLAIDAYLQARDVDATLDAMKRYYELDPFDQGAQVQRIEMYVSLQQSAEQRLDYLKQIIKSGLSPEVRSFAAATASAIATERGDAQEARLLLDQALKLNPLNIQALRQRYAQVFPTATASEKVEILLAMLRSNPSQPLVFHLLAQLFAGSGLYDESAMFYNGTIELTVRTGHPLEYGLLLDAAVEEAIAGMMDNARNLVANLVANRPDDFSALLLQATLERASGENQKESLKKTVQQSLNACYNRVARLRQAMGTVLGATTRQATDETELQWGDLEGDLKELRAAARSTATPSTGSGGEASTPATTNEIVAQTQPATEAATNPATMADASATAPATAPSSQAANAQVEQERRQAILAQYADAVADAAWIYLYFNNDTKQAEPLIDALKAGLPEKDQVLARLEGWLYLLQDKPEQAQQKLSAVADRDPLSELGLIRLKIQQDKGIPDQATRDRAQAMIDKHPASALGITLWEAFRSLDLRPRQNSTEALAMRKLFQAFPQRWVQIFDQPQLFYTVQVEPLKVPHKFGEPMLARLTIENISDYDITIGREGVLHPEALFNVQIHGRALAAIPGVAVERISRRLVLKARPAPLPPQTAPPVPPNPAESSISFIVRLDAGALQEKLNQDPVPAIQLNFDVLINPVSPEAFGPAGMRVPFNRVMERSATPVANLQQMVNNLNNASADDILHVLDLCNDLLIVSQRDPHAPQSQLAFFFSVIRSKLDDKYPSVRAWSNFLFLGILKGQALQLRLHQCEGALNDPLWTKRLLAMMQCSDLPADWQQKHWSDMAAHDADPTVKRVARCLLEFVNLAIAQHAATAPSATAPALTTEPATEPSIEPATNPSTIPSPEATTLPTTEPGPPTSAPATMEATPPAIPGVISPLSPVPPSLQPSALPTSLPLDETSPPLIGPMIPPTTLPASLPGTQP